MHLFDYLDSGNGFKVRLLLAQLGQTYDWTNVDIDKGETRTPEFLKRNPNGRIPTLRLDDGTYLAESNAILWYLAEGSRFVPATQLGRAQVLQWMFFEQYSHEPYVATSRYICRHFPADHPRRAELPMRNEKGHAALKVMEDHLATRAFFVNERYGIADIALYAYTHVAPDGGVQLDAYPNVRAWIARVAAQPNYIQLLAVPNRRWLPERLCTTPEPPYYAVIFTSQRTAVDDGYDAMATAWPNSRRSNPAFLGVESVRDATGLGITVSYWLHSMTSPPGVGYRASCRPGSGSRKWYQHFEGASRAWSGLTPAVTDPTSPSADADWRSIRLAGAASAVSLAPHAQTRVLAPAQRFADLALAAAARFRRLFLSGASGTASRAPRKCRNSRSFCTPRIRGTETDGARVGLHATRHRVAFVVGLFTRWAGLLCAIHFAIAIFVVDYQGGAAASFRPGACW
jgi:glutathione S-transferase